VLTNYGAFLVTISQEKVPEDDIHFTWAKINHEESGMEWAIMLGT